MRKLIPLLFCISLIAAAMAQEYVIDDFESIDDWQVVDYYGMSKSTDTFNPNGTSSIKLTNNLNYGDEILKPLDIVKSYLRYDRIVFWYYSNNTYTDVVLKIVDKGGNERCQASVTFGMELGVWHLFNKTILDFQDCKNKYMSSLGSMSLYLNDYPSDFYAGPILLVSSDLIEENFTSEPGWIYVYDIGVSPTISPKGKPVSISCKVSAENFIENVTVNIFSYGFNQTSFMEKVIGNLTHGTYRYILDPQPADPDGTYFFRIHAVDYGGNSTYSDLYTFTINSTLRISFETDRHIYNISDVMHITGTAQDVNYHDVPGNLTVSLSDTGWNDSFSDGNFFGTFDTDYTLTNPPPGTINLELFFDDQHGNTGEAIGSVYINDPYQFMNYTMIFMSPKNATSYFQGDTLNLESILLQGPNPISDAEVFAIVGQTQVQMFFSGSSYKSNFTLTTIGHNKVTFIGTKNGFMGLNESEIWVYNKPDIDPSIPPPSYPGGTVSISFNITFDNGTPMTNLNITANSPTGEFPLYETEPGVYNGTYTPGLGDVGEWDVTVDVNGNTLGTGMSISVNLLSLEAIVIIVVLVVISLAVIMIKLRGV